MTNPEDFKTRLKIAKSKIKKQVLSDRQKRGSFMGKESSLTKKNKGNENRAHHIETVIKEAFTAC